MFETLRKKALKTTLVWSIILMIIGLGLIIFRAQATFYTVFGYAKFENLEPDKIKNQLVDVEMTLNYGYFGEEYETKSNSTYRKTTHYYCVIPTGDTYTIQNTNDWFFMGIKLPASYEKQLDQIGENTYSGYFSNPLSVSGKIRKLSDEEYRYFKKFFKDYFNFTDTDMEDFTLPYYIDVINNKVVYNILSVLVFLAGLVLIAVGIIRIVKAAKGETLKDLRKTIAEAGCTEASAEADYNAAQTFTKDGNIRVGKIFTYYITGATPKAIPNSKIMWTYQTTTTHRTNGIKTGTSYSLMVYVDGVKNNITLSMPNEAVTREILRKMDETLPWVVVGYTDDLKRLFNKNRTEFLDLRYNKVEHVAVEPGYNNVNNE